MAQGESQGLIHRHTSRVLPDASVTPTLHLSSQQPRNVPCPPSKPQGAVGESAGAMTPTARLILSTCWGLIRSWQLTPSNFAGKDCKAQGSQDVLPQGAPGLLQGHQPSPSSQRLDKEGGSCCFPGLEAGGTQACGSLELEPGWGGGRARV